MEKGEKDTEGRAVVSKQSHVSVIVNFKNCTNEAVDALWLNYEGQKVPYAVIPPSGSWTVQTFLTHPWMFVRHETDERRLVGECEILFPRGTTRCQYQITYAPPLLWSPENHKYFPENFRKKVLLLLMIHARPSLQEPSGRQRVNYSSRDARKKKSKLPWFGQLPNLRLGHLAEMWQCGRQTEERNHEDSSVTLFEDTEGLCALPWDLLFHIIRLSAPYIPDIKPTPASKNNPIIDQTRE